MADDSTSVTHGQPILLDEDVAFNIVLEKVILRKRRMEILPDNRQDTTSEKTREDELGG